MPKQEELSPSPKDGISSADIGINDAPNKTLNPDKYKHRIGAPAPYDTGFTMRPDEFVPESRRDKSHRTYREMRENSSILSGIMMAFETFITPAGFRFDPADETEEAKEMAELAQSFLDDMNGGLNDFLATAVSYLSYGFSAFEIVLKTRGGRTGNKYTDSAADDGLYGLRALEPRAQWTVYRWNYNEDGEVVGLQQSVIGSQTHRSGLIDIPTAKLVIFRNPAPNRDPSGRSVLRGAYRNWYYASRIEEFEAIGIERNLVGIPHLGTPMEWSDGTPEQRQFVDNYNRFGMTAKKNQITYLHTPTNQYLDNDGKPTGEKMVTFELVKAPGHDGQDPDISIQRHHKYMASSVLADFMMLGQGSVGSHALSQDKTYLFLRMVQGVAENMARVIDTQIIERLWSLNNLDPKLCPKAKFDDITKKDSREIAETLRALSAAGMPIFPDVKVENYIRRELEMPEVDEDRELDDPDMRIGMGYDAPNMNPADREMMMEDKKKEEMKEKNKDGDK